MLADLGFYLLFLCTLLSGYSTLSSIIAGRTRHRRLFRSARVASTLSAVSCLVASFILWFLLFQHDYSVAYIFKNSSNDLPPIFRITAFWSSLEGSHTLWTLLLSICSAIALWTAARDNEHIMPWVNAALQSVLTWMFYMAISHSDPFTRMFPPMPNGQGMNALLQNPYMAIHPPTLFIGYTALAIPFAYAIAALCYGDVTDGWLRTTRRWALFAWSALTCGVWLGGRWCWAGCGGWHGRWGIDDTTCLGDKSTVDLALTFRCQCLLNALELRVDEGNLSIIDPWFEFGLLVLKMIGDGSKCRNIHRSWLGWLHLGLDVVQDSSELREEWLLRSLHAGKGCLCLVVTWSSRGELDVNQCLRVGDVGLDVGLGFAGRLNLVLAKLGGVLRCLDSSFGFFVFLDDGLGHGVHVWQGVGR